MDEEISKVSKVATQVMELTGQLSDIFKAASYQTIRENA